MNRAITADQIHPPFSAYSHGLLVPAGAHLLFCSGQLGVSADAKVPEGAEAQTLLCFENIRAVLEAASMTLADIVHLRAFVTDRDHLQGYMSIRNGLFGNPLPASTLMVVSGFSRPEFVVEIEAIAAKA